MSYTLSKEAISFFMYSYLGIEMNELDSRNKESIIDKCARRAYLDLSRTLEFTEKITDNMKPDEKKRVEKKHQTFRDEICKIIKNPIIINLLTSNDKNFDSSHNQACTLIRDAARESKVLTEIKNAHENEQNEKFYYGQAQKWLNMTMKYMWLTGIWKDEFDKLMAKIHIPVDSFIIEAIWHEDIDENNRGWIKDNDVNKLSVILPCDNKKRQHKYSDDKVKSWSKWNYNDYSDFQTTLRAWCEKQNIRPLIWEGQAWIKIAKIRKEREQKSEE